MADTALESVQTPSPNVEPVAEPAAPAPTSITIDNDDPNWDDPTKAQLGRDEQGRFVRPRHRSRSSQTHERIGELTRKNAELTEQLAAAKTPPPTEPAKPPAPAPQPTPFQPPPAAAAPPPSAGFPSFDVWLTQEGNSTKGYDDYSDARADWRWQVNAQQQAAAQQMTAVQRFEAERIQAYTAQIADVKKQFSDFDTIVTNAVTVSPIMRAAILASDKGAQIAYALGKQPDLAHELTRQSWYHDPSQAGLMQRYLESLVPSSSPRQQAVPPTGSTATPAPKPPKPPNPVRTGP